MKTSNGISTGFSQLDQLLGEGLPNPSLTIVGSRPAMGKTSFSIQMATNIALNAHIPVAIFSLEMSKGQLTQRILTQESEIDASKFNTYNLKKDDFITLAKTMDTIEKSPIYIDDMSSSTMIDICRESHALKKYEKDLGLIFIDEFQSIDVIDNFNRRGAGQFKSVLCGLRNLSMEMEVPIIITSQLSRSINSREDKRPTLSDLVGLRQRDVEKYADIVAFLYREDYYKTEAESQSGISEIIIAQNKMGSCGTIKLRFDKNIVKFRNLEGDV